MTALDTAMFIAPASKERKPFFEVVAYKMSTRIDTPLERARLKLEQIERELKKSPDFQLYIIARSRAERARMRRVLMQIPQFRLWRILTNSVERARRRAASFVSTAAEA